MAISEHTPARYALKSIAHDPIRFPPVVQSFHYGDVVKLVGNFYGRLREGDLARVWYYTRTGRVWVVFWAPHTTTSQTTAFPLLTEEFRLSADFAAGAPMMPFWANDGLPKGA